MLEEKDSPDEIREVLPNMEARELTGSDRLAEH
jgi:hypothetical protein